MRYALPRISFVRKASLIVISPFFMTIRYETTFIYFEKELFFVFVFHFFKIGLSHRETATETTSIVTVIFQFKVVVAANRTAMFSVINRITIFAHSFTKPFNFCCSRSALILASLRSLLAFSFVVYFKRHVLEQKAWPATNTTRYERLSILSPHSKHLNFSPF